MDKIPCRFDMNSEKSSSAAFEVEANLNTLLPFVPVENLGELNLGEQKFNPQELSEFDLPPAPLHHFNSEDNTPREGMGGNNDSNMVQISETNNDFINLPLQNLPEFASTSFNQKAEEGSSIKNRFSLITHEDKEAPPLKGMNKVESMPMIFQRNDGASQPHFDLNLKGTKPAVSNFYQDLVLEDSDDSDGKSPCNSLNTGRFQFAQKINEGSATFLVNDLVEVEKRKAQHSKSIMDSNPCDPIFNEKDRFVLNDFSHGPTQDPSANMALDRFESNTADGIKEKHESHINLPQISQLLPSLPTHQAEKSVKGTHSRHISVEAQTQNEKLPNMTPNFLETDKYLDNKSFDAPIEVALPRQLHEESSKSIKGKTRDGSTKGDIPNQDQAERFISINCKDQSVSPQEINGRMPSKQSSDESHLDQKMQESTPEPVHFHDHQNEVPFLQTEVRQEDQKISENSTDRKANQGLLQNDEYINQDYNSNDNIPSEDGYKSSKSLIKKKSLKEVKIKITGRFEESVYEGKNSFSQPEDGKNYIGQDIHNSKDETPPSRFQEFERPCGVKKHVNNITKQNSVNLTSGIMMPLSGKSHEEDCAQENRFIGNQTSKVRNHKSFGPKSLENQNRFKMTKSPTLNFEDRKGLNFHARDYEGRHDETPCPESSHGYPSSKHSEEVDQPQIEEEKQSFAQDTKTIVSNRGSNRIRGGAVTQGFMGFDKRKPDIKKYQQENIEKTEKYTQQNDYQSYPAIQHPQIYGRYENVHRSPYGYIHPYEAQNEMGDSKEEPNYNMIHASYIHNFQSRTSDYLNTMSEMMSTMCAYNSKNFKIMMDSHTQIMSKLLDKVNSPKRPKNTHESNKDD
ncbi:unnamed protein product [Moneuplotes crassus]|uniref:Uncharacterized protein n=1 Tax=Euplotes crassus TaxID=5936 RepID=A0AAD2D8X7_EUPCR|nr:unnamed protein product [Moneuplotes crassus]